jgi:hypothetical protein
MEGAESEAHEDPQQAASEDDGFGEDAEPEEGRVPSSRIEFTDNETKALLRLIGTRC